MTKIFVYKKFLPAFYTLAGSFIIALGWGKYHLDKHNLSKFLLTIFAIMFAVALLYRLGLFLFDKFFPRFRRHPFWHTEFRKEIDEIFFVSALWFGVFLIRVEIYSLLYVLVVLLLLFFVLRRVISRHPASRDWLSAHNTLGLFAFVLFVIQALFQYLSYRWYILDANIKFYNIVLFRSFAMTAVWLLAFAVAGIIVARLAGRLRFGMLALCSALFLLFLLFWGVNLSLLYYSGLQFDPTALAHLSGSSGLVKWGSLIYPVLGLIFLAALFLFALIQMLRAHSNIPRRQWYAYYGGIIALAIMTLFSFGSLKNTPERVVISSFYNFYFGSNTAIKLDPALVQKLKNFGLNYNPDTFYVAEHDRVYSASSSAPLISKKLAVEKPNVIIVFLESYSARLTSVYDNRFPGLTPGLEQMALNKNTTVFNNHYNASTPTVTGLLSLLCSILPPTGHNEIQNDKKLHRHRLLCLPEVLKKNGYTYIGYVTAVAKDFANKDGIFASMGTDETFGTEELKKFIPGTPLSWGYSDHQLFPFLWKLASEKQKPFLLMLSTVDTHPPFNLAEDEVKYGDGAQQLLNSFHTTDDAFLKFWQDFRSSSLADNTIVVAVADHAVFPGAYDKATFPKEFGKLNFYDKNVFLMYVPGNAETKLLPKKVEIITSGLDLTPTLLQILGYTLPNSFEGHSAFDDRKDYQNILGMHELGLYINQKVGLKRQIDYNVPTEISCSINYLPLASSFSGLSLCDYLQFYKWKRQMFEEGRFWKE
ncbi:MAG: LTA synthase family protein [Candidatus Magasanikbacteria bacterium]|nr:LTA synthase family protein [Candidatus Magasanikbacteria bacterium]